MLSLIQAPALRRVHWRPRAACALLTSPPSLPTTTLFSHSTKRHFSMSPVQYDPKRIGVIGGGTAGIGALIGILDVPLSARRDWHIELLERRAEVGGLWNKDPNDEVRPPVIPESPAYPLLHTNTPSPTMTYPNLPVAPGSALFPSYPEVQRYHAKAVSHFNLRPHIRFNSEVTNAEWDSRARQWVVNVTEEGGKETKREYDHLVVANGHLLYPTVPTFKGQEEWIEGGEEGDREILHALWYRDPAAYRGRTVVVVGFGASGWDMSSQTVFHADKVYHSYTEKPGASIHYAPVPGTTPLPRISHLTKDAIVFTDGTEIDFKKVSVLVGTGYDLLIPFLPMLKIGKLDPGVRKHPLTTNKRYLRPLLHDTFAIQDDLPIDALAFSGLHSFLSNAQASYAQGLLMGHTWAAEGGGEAFFGQTRDEQYDQLHAMENRLRSQGQEPFNTGHKYQKDGDPEDWMDGLINTIRAKSSVPLPEFLTNPNKPYTPQWRRTYALRKTAFFLRKGWRRAKELGVEEQFVEGVETEEEWVEAMVKLDKWEKDMDEKVQRREITYQTPPAHLA